MLHNYNPSRAQKLLEHLATGQPDTKGTISNRLLSQLWRGFPIDRLKVLLRSEEGEARKNGIWLVSELGVKGNPLLDEVKRLLNDTEAFVRYYAVNSLICIAPEDNPQLTFTVACMIDDPDKSVQLSVMNFLSRSSQHRLSIVHSYLQECPNHETFSVGLELICIGSIKFDKSLFSTNVVLRRCYVVALARQNNRAQMQDFIQDNDPAIHHFVSRYLAE